LEAVKIREKNQLELKGAVKRFGRPIYNECGEALIKLLV